MPTAHSGGRKDRDREAQDSIRRCASSAFRCSNRFVVPHEPRSTEPPAPAKALSRYLAHTPAVTRRWSSQAPRRPSPAGKPIESKHCGQRSITPVPCSRNCSLSLYLRAQQHCPSTRSKWMSMWSPIVRNQGKGGNSPVDRTHRLSSRGYLAHDRFQIRRRNGYADPGARTHAKVRAKTICLIARKVG